jgi:nucleoside-diphosphate-sugar epimerase
MGGLMSKPLPASDLAEVLAASEGVWDSLRGSSILVTGATGFFGRWMLESLVHADAVHGLSARIVGLSRDPDRFLKDVPHLRDSKVITWRKGSVTTLEVSAFKSDRFTHVLHLATEGDVEATRRDPKLAIDVIAGGTDRTLAVAQATGASRFLFTSTGAVYGNQPQGISHLSEDFPAPTLNLDDPDPERVGAAAKQRAERACLEASAQSSLSSVIARCFSFSGPAVPLDRKFAFGSFMRDAQAGREIIVKGDGTPIRSYLYASDLCSWLWTLLVHGARGDTYNVGSETAVSIADLATMIRQTVGSPGIKVMGQPDPNKAPHRYVPSTFKIRTALGVKDSVALSEGVRRTAAWLKS